jgi:hypothetical protein
MTEPQLNALSTANRELLSTGGFPRAAAALQEAAHAFEADVGVEATKIHLLLRLCADLLRRM